MSQPEISHRCPSCGVAVREADALFCRECGKPLTAKSKGSEPAEAGEVSQNAPAEINESPPKPAEASPESTETKPAEEAEAKSEPSANPGESAAAPPVARRGDKTRERLHRASEVARGVTRGVIEEPARQVEKIRHVSTVMIEEASYDPSLRFVLVALGLFVVFVILLVLSKVMG